MFMKNVRNMAFRKTQFKHVAHWKKLVIGEERKQNTRKYDVRLSERIQDVYCPSFRINRT